MKTPRSKKYMAWIRTMPCVVSGSEYDVIAHHVRTGNGGGIGMKVSDYRTIPLRADIHVDLHSGRVGEKEWYAENNLDFDAIVLTHMVAYTREMEIEKHAMVALEKLFVEWNES